MSEQSLRITEIFHSLQGETSTVGLPTVFVRLTGCPLRCGYCDTAYAFEGGSKMEPASDTRPGRRLRRQPCHRHRRRASGPAAMIELLKQLCDQGYRVSLETSGAMPLKMLTRVVKIVDLKTPGSGEWRAISMTILTICCPMMRSNL